MSKTQLPAIASLFLLLGNASCFDTDTTLCATGIRCPVDQGCAANQQVCITSPCGNGLIDIDEVCDDGNIQDGDGCSRDCLSLEVCGNGIPDRNGKEECDDGGESALCDTDCSIAMCGDGRLNLSSGEECDTLGGNSETCDSDCTFAFCGDGFLNRKHWEDCDDGGESASCDVDCTPASCNDGVVNTSHLVNGEHPEECDDGGESFICNANCTLAICGDGYLNITRGEECDDRMETLSCDADCTIATCLDGTLNVTRGEQCDESSETATCDFDCTFSTCQDGHRNFSAGEQCDDGHPSERCDQDCTAPYCGDGVPNPSLEQCDTITETSSCNMNFAATECYCTVASCGDGCVNALADEECDNGDVGYGGNGCDEFCRHTTGRACTLGNAVGDLNHLGRPAADSGLAIIERQFALTGGNDADVYDIPKPLGLVHVVPLVSTYNSGTDNNYAWDINVQDFDTFVRVSISAFGGNHGGSLFGKIVVFGYDGVLSRIVGPSNPLLDGERFDLTSMQMAVRTKVFPLVHVEAHITDGDNDFSWGINTQTDPSCGVAHYTSYGQDQSGNNAYIEWVPSLFMLPESVRVDMCNFELKSENDFSQTCTFQIDEQAEQVWLPIVNQYEAFGSRDFSYNVFCVAQESLLKCYADAWAGGAEGPSVLQGKIILLESLKDGNVGGF